MVVPRNIFIETLKLLGIGIGLFQKLFTLFILDYIINILIKYLNLLILHIELLQKLYLLEPKFVWYSIGLCQKYSWSGLGVKTYWKCNVLIISSGTEIYLILYWNVAKKYVDLILELLGDVIIISKDVSSETEICLILYWIVPKNIFVWILKLFGCALHWVNKNN